MKRFMLLVTIGLWMCWSTPARADLLIYKFGGGRMLLQGKVTINQGKTVSFKHPEFKDELYFALEDIKKVEADTTEELFGKMLNKARAAKDAEEVFQAAVWALKHGLLDQYYQAIDETLKINPQHDKALKVLSLREKMRVPIAGDSKEQEDQMRKVVKKANMRVDKSEHFILLHDTPEDPPEGEKITRAKKRLKLLEQVYSSFVLMFYSQGIELDIPKERLMVVLFNNFQDYEDFSLALNPNTRGAIGFWEPHRNIAFFFDHGTSPWHAELKAASDEIQGLADELKALKPRERPINAKDIIRFANALEMLIKIDQENSDINVVSHECTHQMAGNTGLFPRSVDIPRWVHEGLASYFEAPGQATWAGIGAVNEERLDFYRALESIANLEVVVGDQVFEYAGNQFSVLHAYAQSWAMTHFLLAKHFDKFITYYRLLGEMPRDLELTTEVMTNLFKSVFGDDLKALEQEWRSYMRSLKTDEELLIEKSKKKR